MTLTLSLIPLKATTLLESSLCGSPSQIPVFTLLMPLVHLDSPHPNTLVSPPPLACPLHPNTHQIMAWVGLEHYGYLEDTQRLAYHFLYMCVLPLTQNHGILLLFLLLVLG